MEKTNPAGARFRSMALISTLMNLFNPQRPVSDGRGDSNRYGMDPGFFVTGGGRGTPKKRTSRPKKKFHRQLKRRK